MKIPLVARMITHFESQRTQQVDPDMIRVTDLVNPPLIRTLKQNNADLLIQDPVKGYYTLFGNFVHYCMEKAYTEGTLLSREYRSKCMNEERLNFEFELDTKAGRIKKVVTGQFDFYDGNLAHLTDIKTCKTSIESYGGVNDDWVKQLNIYAFMLRSMKYPVRRLSICKIYKNWSQMMVGKKRDYPVMPFTEQEIELWPQEKAHDYILERLADHTQSPTRPCTDLERWGDGFAVKLKGAPRAVNGGTKFESVQQAQDFIDNMPDDKRDLAIIEDRTGKNIRCKHYCDVSSFCPYFHGK